MGEEDTELSLRTESALAVTGDRDLGVAIKAISDFVEEVSS